MILGFCSIYRRKTGENGYPSQKPSGMTRIGHLIVADMTIDQQQSYEFHAGHFRHGKWPND